MCALQEGREVWVSPSPAGVPTRAGSRYVTLGLLGVVVPVLLVMAIAVTLIVSQSFHELDAVRAAQLARADVIRLQIDEEAGLRGFTSTHDRVFFDQYHVAAQRFPAALAQLRASLSSVGLSSANASLDEFSTLDRTWHTTVVNPLLAVGAPQGASAAALQLRGKRLTDRFRNENNALREALERHAAQLSSQTEALVKGLLAATVLVVLLFALGAVVNGRIARRLFEALDTERAERLRVIAAADAQRRTLRTVAEMFTQHPLPDVPLLDFDAVYMPAAKEAYVGGDWYDAVQLPDGRIMFSVGDVSGHGIEAAVTMALARQAIVTAALHEHDPSAVLANANAALQVRRLALTTAICGYIDPQALEIVYATAGHPPAILVDPDGSTRVLPYSGTPLGLGEDHWSRTFVTRANDRAMLVLYTDGAVEIERDLFAGERNLLAASVEALAAGSRTPAQLIRERLFSRAEPQDDVAILTVCFKAAEMTAADRAAAERFTNGDVEIASRRSSKV